MAEYSVEHFLSDVMLHAFEQLMILCQVAAVKFLPTCLSRALEKNPELLLRRMEFSVRLIAKAEYGFVCLHRNTVVYVVCINHTEMQGRGQEKRSLKCGVPISDSEEKKEVRNGDAPNRHGWDGSLR